MKRESERLKTLARGISEKRKAVSRKKGFSRGLGGKCLTGRKETFSR